MTKMQIWVVKAGSQMVCAGGPLLIRAWMQQVAQLRKRHNVQVIWVTSGAIAWASERTNFHRPKRTLPQKQALSAIGQPLIMDQYNIALQSTGLLGSQVLLTASDIRDPRRSRNLRNTLRELLQWKVVPILNENDAVSTEEIQFGDNDSLAAQVAVMVRAQKLVLLTDVDGLFSADPKLNPQASIIAYRAKVSRAELALVDRKSKSKVGTGGMQSKLLSAQLAGKHRIVTHLARGDWPANLLLIAEGRPPGTQIGGTRHD